MALQKIYMISGLGADQRTMSSIKLPGFDLIFLPWIKPEPQETIEAYSARMAACINQSEPFGLLGVSMGGIIAHEISKRIPVKTCVILSSVKAPSEFSLNIKLAKALQLDRFFSGKILKKLNHLSSGYFFSVKSKSSNRLLQAVIEDTDTFFLKWALRAILEWRGSTINPDLIHIHGSRDRVFPIRYLKSNYIPIAGAGHFMIVERTAEINKLLCEIFTHADDRFFRTGKKN